MDLDMFYTLNGHEAVPVEGREWTLLPIEQRRVAEDQVGDRWVSTVFTGMNTNLWGEPLVFETMVFRDGEGFEGDDAYTQRYATWTEAEVGHLLTVEAVGGAYLQGA